MKTANAHIAASIGKFRTVILVGTLAAVATTVACSTNKSESKVSSTASSAPMSASLHPAALKTIVPAAENATVASVEKPAKPSGSKLNVYRSRNYGVSFLYPWQYRFVSAKSVAGNETMLPKSYGHDGQFTLVRIDIPRGYYADTDFESGYFAVSLNQDVNEQECQSTLVPAKDAKVQTDTINGVAYSWIETENGGRGYAEKVRQYVTFTNGMCYELELGVKTSNEGGLAREVDADQVMRRLDSILTSVKISQSTEKPAEEVKTSTAVTPPVPQN